MLGKLKSIEDLLLGILSSDMPLKMSATETINSSLIGNAQLKIEQLVKLAKENSDCILLVRGINEKKIKDLLIGKLNSNDSLYDGLFLVGQKAKNYLHEEKSIPHPIQRITETGLDVGRWIFDEYARLKNAPVDLGYFKISSNKNEFSEKLKGKIKIIDYYLFLLHTINSDFLVNFVSSTTNPGKAYTHDNDLLIIFWLNKEYKEFFVSKSMLQERKEEILKLELPVIRDSSHPEEDEYSIKGFILPHFILGVYNTKNDEFIINPCILQNNENWIKEGFDVDQSSFIGFMKSTTYKRFLTLIDGKALEEENI